MTIALALTEAAQAVGGICEGADVRFTGVSTDSRTIPAGCLFVALRGPRFDGHAFTTAALGTGAVAVMVADDAPGRLHPAIRVADTRLALGALAGEWRRRCATPLVAVTGSTGKTTVKEMLAGVLAAHGGADTVLATRGNLNNDVGVPLTLFGLGGRHRFGVIEMGMNHAGEISHLTRLVRPDVALINNAGTAHVGELGSLDAVARAKGEILEGLSAGGVAVINGDDPYAFLWRSAATGHDILSFGFESDNVVRGAAELVPGGVRLSVTTPAGEFGTVLRVPGRHNAMNALAATAAAIALQIPLPAIAAGLAAYRGVKGRLVRVDAIHGAILIDDTYNANPDSVRAALAVLAAEPGRKLLVLGDMGELGSLSDALHADIGKAARAAGVERMFCLGNASRHAVAAFGPGAMHFERIQELLAEVENALGVDTTVLVKGSRFMEMERVVKSFAHLEEGHAA